MAHLDKVFAFATTSEGWAFTALDSGTGTYQSGSGNPAGAIDMDNQGRNAQDITGYWEWTGTFEDLGITAGSTITGYSSSSLDYSCTYYNTVDLLTVGPFTINDGTARTLGTDPTITGTGGFLTDNQSGTITGLSLASTTSLVIRLTIYSDCGNAAAAGTTVLYDNITVGMDYTEGGGFSSAWARNSGNNLL